MADNETPDIALAEQARGEAVTVVFDGETYTLPVKEDWDIAILEAAEEGRVSTIMRLLLGPEQYAKFRSRHTKIRELNAFAEAIMARYGGNF